MPKAELQGHLNTAGRSVEESLVPKKFTCRQELETLWWRTCKERFGSGHLGNQEGLLTPTPVNKVGPLKTEVEGIWDPFGCFAFFITSTERQEHITLVDDRGKACTLGMEG